MTLLKDLKRLFNSLKTFNYKVELPTQAVLSYHYDTGFDLRSRTSIWLKTNAGNDNWKMHIHDYDDMARPLCDRNMRVTFMFNSQRAAVGFKKEFGGRV